MNSKTNYTLVGIFVVLSVMMIFVFVIWMIKPTNEQEVTPYKIYFTESVSGLNVNAPVKYRGVTIGKVTKMRINPTNNEEIEVKILVDKEAPIKEDTVAKLKSQGITGLNYIDLSQGSQEAPLLCESQNNNGEFVITSVPSFLARVEESFGSVSVNLSKTLHATGTLLRDENQEAITKTLFHLASSLEKIDKALNDKSIQEFQSLIASANRSSKHFERTLPKVDTLIIETGAFEKRVADALNSISNSYLTIASSLAVFEERNRNGDYSMKNSTAEPMKQFGITMREMQRTLLEVNELLARYGDSPSNMLLQSEEPNVGPGEK